jgi:hypothetical protein
MLGGILGGIRCAFPLDPLAPLLSIRRWMVARGALGRAVLGIFRAVGHAGSPPPGMRGPQATTGRRWPPSMCYWSPSSAPRVAAVPHLVAALDRCLCVCVPLLSSTAGPLISPCVACASRKLVCALEVGITKILIATAMLANPALSSPVRF